MIFLRQGRFTITFPLWTRDGTLKQISRRATGGESESGQSARRSPAAACIDSQSAKTNEQGGIDGYDAGKKIMGRKRHILVDTIGADFGCCRSFCRGSKTGMEPRRFSSESRRKIHNDWSSIWADGGYAGKLIEWVKPRMWLGVRDREAKRRHQGIQAPASSLGRGAAIFPHGWEGFGG